MPRLLRALDGSTQLASRTPSPNGAGEGPFGVPILARAPSGGRALLRFPSRVPKLRRMNLRRRFVPALVLAALTLLAGVGCSSSYVITTTSGAKIITASKPKLIDSMYVYRDANGGTNRISKLRVRVVEPYSKEAAGRQLQAPQLK